jgi:hypothetical protein
MLTTAHLLLGAAIGKATNNPLLTVVLAFGTHYILDAIPHYSEKPITNFQESGIKRSNILEIVVKSIEPALGIILTLVLIFRFNSTKALPMVLGSFFGWLPDLMVLLDWKFGIPRPRLIAEFEKKYHHHTTFVKSVVPFLFISISCAIYLLLG